MKFFRMGEPFTSDFKITTREPSFVLQNATNQDQDQDKMKAHSSSMYTLISDFCYKDEH